MVKRFDCFEEYKGEVPQRQNGAIISQGAGTTTAYALNSIGARAILFLPEGKDVYEGMIVGQNSRKEDMVVNAAKGKKQTNMRASGSDSNIKLAPPKVFSLEEALEFINDDELVEVVPGDIRLRKKYLNRLDRHRKS
ncbi:MAG: translational GTPase TypA, partial [Anaerovoracaceae bacterium]